MTSNINLTINAILAAALKEIRDNHGVAVGQINVEWVGTLSNQAAAITKIEFSGMAVS
ncbi:hypothetical protein [Neopusillimonas aromaticivorans]|uniref:hypothetical protein n=1 Tax=Neopusillimonas aromaticivorans TaxID=2979868 RepID=UPI00259694AC|nr:hypothetical protein [Neopusillimonas aromaticivorans]WJJ93402.1 hypothetical protein N7E01_15785 [Neopusillimonas aromaticivorans]